MLVAGRRGEQGHERCSAQATAAAVRAAATAGASAAVTQPSSLDYYTDTLLRTNPQLQTSAAGNAAPGGAPNGGAATNGMNSQMQRQQVSRITA